ncbi:MAG: hypothetical protein LQ346_004908 [Caloplaca aetnensis]|nr:MAG: hypothetical protein LQ346_004908 [Caloplaca aetnensis]
MLTGRDTEYLNGLQDRVLQTLLDQNPARTNPFDVAARLEGLQEKFRVFDNDELADALNDRVDELSSRSIRWTPEVLSLFLGLSDRPLQETKIDGLAELRPEPQPMPLTWSDIFADDPLDNDEGIWDDVDFARDGSDEDADSIIHPSRSSDASSTTSNELYSGVHSIEDLILPPDNDGLKDVIKAQFWSQAVQGASETNHSRRSITESFIDLTEAQTIREVGFMLHGLPTTIYEQHSDGGLHLSTRYRLKHIPQGQATGLLRGLSAIGAALANLRTWKSQDQQYPLSQTFQAIVAERLAAVEETLTRVELHCLDSNWGHTASLLCYYDKVESETALIRQLGAILEELEHDRNPAIDRSVSLTSRFRVLELLYDRVCLCHSIGEMTSFDYFAEIFSACLQTYLKPLKHWMECGELVRLDQDIFIKDGDSDTGLDDMWARRHLLLLDASGQLHAPTFLHLASKRILNTGKSIHFLRLLGYCWPDGEARHASTTQFDLMRVCQTVGAEALTSFSESFDRALDGWIAESHQSSSFVLRQQLEVRCGLSRVLEALDYLYLSRNGALFSSIVSAISARMNRRESEWSDNLVLTELFREVFATTICVDTEKLIVRTSRGSIGSMSSRQQSMEKLSTLRVIYSLPWPVANIVSKKSMRTYQSVLILLLQLQRAKQALERRIPRSTMSALMRDPVGCFTVKLRHQLLLFVNSVLSYLVDVVLSAATATMRQQMAKSNDLDELVGLHQSYVARLEEDCLLSNERKPVMQAIISVLDLIILLTEACASYGRQTPTRDGHLPRGPTPKTGRRSHASVGIEEHSSSDRDESEDASDVPKSHRVGLDVSTETPSARRLKYMHSTFQQLQGFILVSLRGGSRSGDYCGASMLADMLATSRVREDPECG